MTILVTGAAGFIGMHVAAALLARGERVVGIDNFTPYYSVELKHARIAHLEQLGGEFLFRNIDFGNAETLNEALAREDIDRIVHLGAQPGVRYSLENPAAYIHSNIAGHLNILEFARHRGTSHLVYASSSSVYGMRSDTPFRVEDRADTPISLYAATKRADELMSETYAHLFRIPQTGLRFFTVYGPWGRPDMAVWKFTEAVLAGQPIDVYNHGDMLRDFTFIDDIVSGILLTLDNPPADDGKLKPGGFVSPHRLYNIGNNRPEQLMDLISTIEAACQRSATINLLPMQDGDVYQTFADIDDIANDLGFAPTTPISVGVPVFVGWYLARTEA
ncbi:MAG: NAD-dependent epimerase/dehydratase family protein [Sphingopyxis sp.]|uniref:NAD-dependent epimerase/dehydratase family protein n=1 Tax=Sphingopyxis sp. TaxID=1908224 RepID=UPI002AB95DB5|nr:NAD-dependent epimerase/dehydratase family protein [Sphingopyxis sp.]MDZ3831658.1 NAD-dependent epimerase/dehydratase family protein [Sphingopyxis sp.]